MIRLRPYKPCDAQSIAAWIDNEEIFHMWGGDRFGSFPITADVMERKYTLDNGDCAEPDNFFPWTAVNDADEPVGHFIMRYLNGDRRVWRFGWVIVNPSLRGSGYGTQMLVLGLKYAFGFLGAEKVTIGVFENNLPAYHCYLRAGFHERETVDGTPWRIIEMETDRTSYAGKERPDT